MKVAICTNFVSPYRSPVFASIANQTGADTRIFVNTTMEADRNWNIHQPDNQPFTTRRSFSLRRTRTLGTRGAGSFVQTLERHYPIGLPVDLIKFNPDIIISGELGPRTMLALAAGAITQTPVIPWTYHASAQTSAFGPTHTYRKRILNKVPAVIGMGSQARHVLESLGCNPSKVFDAPNAADFNSIEKRLESQDHKASKARIKRLCQGKRIAVVVGRLVEMKGIQKLCDAWNALPHHLQAQWTLVFVGDGPLMQSIKQTNTHSIQAVGHKQPNEIADWLAAADLHIFASLGDPWGLVVNEAMQCATPTLCSTHAGCSTDLIKHNDTGFLFDPTKPAFDVAADIKHTLQTPSLQHIGVNARSHIQRFTPESMANGFVQAINSCLRTKAPQRKESA